VVWELSVRRLVMIYYGNPEEYIYETPSILKRILENKAQIFKDALENIDWEKCPGLYLAGSGSSYHGALCARPFLEKILGCPVEAWTPMNFIEKSIHLNENCIVIGISQQGTSLSSIQALDCACEKGLQTISMTGEYDTEIMRHASSNVYIECGIEDAGATTKGYTATAFTLILLGLETAARQKKLPQDEYDALLERLKATIDGMANVLSAAEEWYRRNRESLLSCQQMVVTGSARNLATVLEGTLKIMETCRFPVRGYEAEEFMHGIYNSVDEHTQMLISEHPEQDVTD